MEIFQKKYWERKQLKKRRHPSHIAIKEFVLPKINAIKKVVPINRKTKLLDVGAGNGFFSYYFDKICDTTAIDYSEQMIKLNPIKKKRVMDANKLEYKDNIFDIVFCHALLHHIEDIDQVIKEMARVSKEYIIILEPNRNNPIMYLFCLWKKEERKVLKFSLNYLTKLSQKSGLKVISSFSTGMIFANATPKILLPLFRLFNYRFMFGTTNCIICKKA